MGEDVSLPFGALDKRQAVASILGSMSRVEGGTIHCSCGQKFHVSLFRDLIAVAAREAQRLARLDEDAITEAAIHAAYDVGRSMEDDAGGPPGREEP